jgi:hypothetical protein
MTLHVSHAAFVDELEKIAKGTLIMKGVKGLTGAVTKAGPGRAAKTVSKATSPQAAESFSLAGQKAISGASPSAIKTQQGVHSAGNIQKVLQESERAQRAQRWTTAAREGRINRALQEGTLDPKLHSISEFGRTGELVKRAPVSRAARTVEKTVAAPPPPTGTVTGAAMPPPRMPGAGGAMPPPAQSGTGAWYQDPRMLGAGMGMGGMGFGAGAAQG